MAKIKLDEIRKAAGEHGWIVISDTYKNLNTEMEFKCNEGHQVYAPYRLIRNKWECPVCKTNQYYNFKDEVVPKKKGARRTLGLDQATKITGYSVFDNDELVYAGTFEVDPNYTHWERILEMKRWLLQMVNVWKPDMIGFEDIQLQQFNNKIIGVTTYKTLAQLQGVLITTCEEHNVAWELCAPATWRKHCSVKGRTRTDKKASMQRQVKKWFDITVSDDVADAIGIGKYVADELNHEVEIHDWI